MFLRVPTNHLWVGLTVLVLAACSSSARIRGDNEDAGSEAQAGFGSAGSPSDGSAGTGAAGSGGSSGQGAAGSNGNDGSAGTGGGCVQTDVTVDFTVQGNVKRAKFDQSGVTVVGISDLQFSDRTAAEPDAGLGVVGGLFDWSIDSTEFVTFTFTRPATNVKIDVTHALDINNDDVYGQSTITGYDASGQRIDQLEIAGPGPKNLSALFGDVPISKLMIKDDQDGIAVGTLSFAECLD